MPDQQTRLTKFCQRQGWIVVRTYFEPDPTTKLTAYHLVKGIIHDTSSKGRPPFDKILVLSGSLFEEPRHDYLMLEAVLFKRGIDVIILPQFFSDDIEVTLAARLTRMMDEYLWLQRAEDSGPSVWDDGEVGIDDVIVEKTKPTLH